MKTINTITSSCRWYYSKVMCFRFQIRTENEVKWQNLSVFQPVWNENAWSRGWIKDGLSKVPDFASVLQRLKIKSSKFCFRGYRGVWQPGDSAQIIQDGVMERQELGKEQTVWLLEFEKGSREGTGGSFATHLGLSSSSRNWVSSSPSFVRTLNFPMFNFPPLFREI